jgi:hypothetical protein
VNVVFLEIKMMCGSTGLQSDGAEIYALLAEGKVNGWFHYRKLLALNFPNVRKITGADGY